MFIRLNLDCPNLRLVALLQNYNKIGKVLFFGLNGKNQGKILA